MCHCWVQVFRASRQLTTSVFLSATVTIKVLDAGCSVTPVPEWGRGGSAPSWPAIEIYCKWEIELCCFKAHLMGVGGCLLLQQNPSYPDTMVGTRKWTMWRISILHINTSEVHTSIPFYNNPIVQLQIKTRGGKTSLAFGERFYSALKYPDMDLYWKKKGLVESIQLLYVMKMEVDITVHVKRKSMKTTERFKRLKVKANGLIMYQLNKQGLLEPEWEGFWSPSNFSEMYLRYGIRYTWRFCFLSAS